MTRRTISLPPKPAPSAFLPDSIPAGFLLQPAVCTAPREPPYPTHVRHSTVLRLIPTTDIPNATLRDGAKWPTERRLRYQRNNHRCSVVLRRAFLSAETGAAQGA